jgi:hypothetical protein
MPITTSLQQCELTIAHLEPTPVASWQKLNEERLSHEKSLQKRLTYKFRNKTRILDLKWEPATLSIIQRQWVHCRNMCSQLG